jgi:hypothetical protein
MFIKIQNSVKTRCFGVSITKGDAAIAGEPRLKKLLLA